MILILFLVIFLVYKNGVLANKKGRNVIVWVLASIAAYFIAGMIGGGILITAKYNGPIEKETLDNYVQNLYQTNPIIPILIIAFGIGGCLLVRYILEKKDAVTK